MCETRAKGLAHNTGAIWRMPLLSYMVMACAGPVVGAAEALLEIVTEVMKVKVGAYSGDKQQVLMSQKIRVARLAMELDATIRLWAGHIQDLWDQVKNNDTPSRERRAASDHAAFMRTAPFNGSIVTCPVGQHTRFLNTITCQTCTAQHALGWHCQPMQ